ncbi:MAG: MOSC domain-containing protein [Myxococcota bacterium]
MSDGDSGLPHFARLRIDATNPEGFVEAIRVRPERRTPTVEVDSWELGTSVDHSRSSARAVTLFQHEHLDVIARLLGRPVAFEQTRRNLCVRGFNLEISRGRVLEIGETQLQITGRCHPCERMEEALGAGGFVAMFGHGGWTASIVRDGTIRRGDVVRLCRDD